jgi:hypothetical protein
MSDDNMEKVVSQLEETNKKLDVIIDIINKPDSRVGRILEMIAAIAGVLSIISIIDVIRNWLGF